MKVSVKKSSNNNERNFLCYDNTHFFKNFYTNLMNKKQFLWPEHPPFERVEAIVDRVV